VDQGRVSRPHLHPIRGRMVPLLHAPAGRETGECHVRNPRHPPGPWINHFRSEADPKHSTLRTESAVTTENTPIRAVPGTSGAQLLRGATLSRVMLTSARLLILGTT